MSWLERILHSSIGRKVLMALSGLCLVGFLVVHLAGNLTLFADSDGAAFNAYAHALESNPLLPLAEIGLLALFVVHIALGLRVSLANREARKRDYEVRASHGARTLASGSMLVTGVIVLVFLVIHIADFRLPKLLGDAALSDLALAVKRRLASPVAALIYIVGVGALGLHISHAFKSAFQTLGLSHPRYSAWIARGSIVLAVLFFIGFAAFPVYFYLKSGGAH